MNDMTHARMITVDKRSALFTLLGTLGSVLGASAGAALWKISNVSLDVEIYRPGGEYVQVSPPGTVAELQGLPGPWMLLLISIAVGAVSGVATAWALSRTGWRLVRTTTFEVPHEGSPDRSSTDE
ncbi:hypothetical protein [Nocardia sp. NPDC051570]|uniref:hypothetical protein n=1 Tax=Nocardia sp. NPDC051570 TaxID=3364324 RepID=UPI00378B5B18